MSDEKPVRVKLTVSDPGAAKALSGSSAVPVCPTCESTDPLLHPAISGGGEVRMCPDPWHTPRDPVTGKLRFLGDESKKPEPSPYVTDEAVERSAEVLWAALHPATHPWPPAAAGEAAVYRADARAALDVSASLIIGAAMYMPSLRRVEDTSGNVRILLDGNLQPLPPGRYWRLMSDWVPV